MKTALKSFLSLIISTSFILGTNNAFAKSGAKKGKVLIVTTNHDKYNDSDKVTGNWLGEITDFYQEMDDKGYDIDIISPIGGEIPIDPASLDYYNEANRKYYKQYTFSRKIRNTLTPDQVNADDYAVVYFAGGHGTLWDFPNDKKIQAIATKVYENGNVVAAVCHGVSGLLNITLSNGQTLIRGKEITGFSDSEEGFLNVDKNIPYSLEAELKSRGVKYEKGFFPFTPYAVMSERVVTGQNPMSAKAVAKRVLCLLDHK